MTQDITSLVNECLLQHEGGEAFFDAIDEKLRDDKILLQTMINRIVENESFDYLIVSGKFGHVFKNYCKSYQKDLYDKVIVVNGGLRNEDEIIPFWKNYTIQNKNLIFIDDSYYKGRTRDKIKNAIDQNQGNLVNTYVFYDGSKEKDKNVHSFYRYYDYHQIDAVE